MGPNTLTILSVPARTSRAQLLDSTLQRLPETALRAQSAILALLTAQAVAPASSPRNSLSDLAAAESPITLSQLQSLTGASEGELFLSWIVSMIRQSLVRQPEVRGDSVTLSAFEWNVIGAVKLNRSGLAELLNVIEPLRVRFKTGAREETSRCFESSEVSMGPASTLSALKHFSGDSLSRPTSGSALIQETGRLTASFGRADQERTIGRMRSARSAPRSGAAWEPLRRPYERSYGRKPRSDASRFGTFFRIAKFLTWTLKNIFKRRPRD